MYRDFMSSEEASHFNKILLDTSKEYEIEGRNNWRGPPYHMIIHALHLYEKYLSDA